MANVLTKEQVYELILIERRFQDSKWGEDKPQSLPGFLLILQKEIEEAIDGWMKNKHGRDSPLSEVTQIAAVAVACMERYGSYGTAHPTNDTPIEVVGRKPE